MIIMVMELANFIISPHIFIFSYIRQQNRCISRIFIYMYCVSYFKNKKALSSTNFESFFKIKHYHSLMVALLIIIRFWCFTFTFVQFVCTKDLWLLTLLYFTILGLFFYFDQHNQNSQHTWKCSTTLFQFLK